MGAVAIASVFAPKGMPPRMWLVVGVAGAVPDIDAIGRLWGGGDVEWLGGHRALTHSLSFAIGCGALLSLTISPAGGGIAAKIRAWLAVSLAMASHGAIDSLTTYGEGIQFLAPFSEQRYWAAWRPLGDGIARDSIAFLVFYFVSFVMIKRRELPRRVPLHAE